MLYDFLDINKVNQSIDCISMYDQDLVIMKWNRACEKRFRIESSHAVRKNLLDLFPHIKNDYRVACLRDSVKLGKSFYFPGLPFEFSEGYYTQLIMPLKDQFDLVWGTINIIRVHSYPGEVFSRADLLNPLLKNEVLISRLLA